MNVSVERLRVWLLVGAGLLVVVVAGFLGYAHYRAHRFLTNLPGKLGVDVRRESNNVTYSQSVQGRKVYTIHAAKEVERGDGKVTLHDVGIVLYGRKEDRADRIYGNEFEYDQKNGVVRAIGEVHIDLQAPQAADANAKMDYAAGKDLKGAQAGSKLGASVAGGHETKDEHLIHVTTSGLVFLQKLGVAATDKDIEFESGGLTGHAVGADYSSDTGVVVLHSAVKVNGLQRDRPVVLTASHAVLDRPGQTMVLSQAKYVEVGGQTDSAEGHTAQAQHVVVHLRKDGSAERVEADGDVTLTNGAGGSVVAPRGEMTLNALNQPQSAVMMGGVKYASDEPLRQAKGEAAEGRAAFDKRGHPEHVTMSGRVYLQERVRDSAAEPWSEREMNAGAVELALGTDPAGKTLLRDARGTGSARLKQSNVSAKGGTTISEVAGDVLTAHFVRVNGADHLVEVHGDGNTSLRKVAPNGVVNTSSADSTVAHFRPAGTGARHAAGTGPRAKTSSGVGAGADDIADATEQGHVVLTKLPLKKPEAAAPVEERVTAERAVYSGDLDRTTLTGNVQVSDGTNVLWADQVTEQQTGDATAEGSVKASYGEAGSADGPVHVLAARAELKHDSEVAIFNGVPGKPARLWQGTSQVDAPVLEFDRKQKRLLAHGEGQGAPMAVHAVMVKTPSVRSSAKQNAVKSDGITKKVAKGGTTDTDVIRVASRELTYSNEARKAEFSGGVDIESGDGNMKAEQVESYLQPASTSGSGKTSQANGGKVKTGISSSANGSGFIGGKVERMVANGRIEMEQPGRRATGEQLVYTAGDDTYVLTGTAMASPKVVDDQRGAVTGTSLRFHPGDDSVIVSNGGEADAGQRVRTETRVKNKQ